LFVLLSLYLIQIHISEPIGQHMTSPPPPHYVTFSAFLRPSSDIFPLPNDYTDLPAHTVTCVSASPTRVFTWDRLLEDSPRVSSSLPSRVCSPQRGYVFRTFPSSLLTWDLLLQPSQRASSSPPTHVCAFVCLSTSSGHFDLRYCNTLLAHLYSLQYPLLLMLLLSLLWVPFPYIRK